MPWPSLDAFITPLASAASYLPSIPSVPIPAKLQQRLVAFLLRRAIGGFVKGGGHSLGDEGRIEADVRNGRFVIHNVDIDDQAVNSILSPTLTDPSHPAPVSPIRFESGTIGTLTALVTWPLSRFDIQVEDVELVFRFDDQDLPSRSDPPARPNNSPVQAVNSPTAGDEDDEIAYEQLAESNVSLALAHEFVSRELSPAEDAELRASLHLSPSESIDLPGAFGGGPRVADASAPDDSQAEEVEATMLAGVVEKVLARLGIRVRNLRVRLKWTVGDEYQAAAGQSEHELELRIENVAFAGASENISSLVPSGSSKRLSLSPLKVYLHSKMPIPRDAPPAPPARPTRAPFRRSSSSSSSSSSDDEHDLLAMSQSIADLRHSTHSSTSGSRSDVFASATSRYFDPVTEEAEEDDRPESPFVDPDASTSARQNDWRGRPERDSTNRDSTTHTELIASLGTREEIVFRLQKPSTGTSSESEPSRTSSRRSLVLDGSIRDDVVVALRPESLEVLFCLTSRLSELKVDGAAGDQIGRRPPPTTGSASTSGSRVSFEIRAVTVVLASGLGIALPDKFWARPAAPLDLPHLRLAFETISVAIQQPMNELAVAVNAFAMTEVAVAGSGVAHPLPILVSDSSLSAPSLQSWPNVIVHSVDWLANPHEQYGRDWRVHPRASSVRQRQSKAIETLPVDDNPAIHIRSGGEEGPKVRLAPVHAFLDPEILNRHQDLLRVLALSQISSDAAADSRQPSPTPVGPRQATSLPFELSCALMRLELRCPAPLATRREADDPNLMRGGRILLDVCGLSPRFDGTGGQIQLDSLRGHVATPGTSDAVAFFALSQLTQSDESAPALSPVATIVKSPELRQPPRLDVQIPFARVHLRKSTFDALQLCADDLSRFFAKEVTSPLSGGRYDSRESSSNKLIGSRYFGAKSYVRPRQSSRTSGGFAADASDCDSSASTATLIAPRLDVPTAAVPPIATLLCAVTVTDVEAAITLRASEAADTGRTEEDIKFTLADLRVDVAAFDGGPDDLRATLSTMDMRVLHGTNDVRATPPQTIIARTLPRNPTRRAPSMIELVYTCYTDRDTGVKEAKVQLDLADGTLSLGPNIQWLSALQRFVEAPEGVFEEVVPNELVRLRVALHGFSIKLATPAATPVVVITLDKLRLRSDLKPDLLRTILRADLSGASVLAIQNDDDLVADSAGSEDERSQEFTGHWKSLGFTQVAADLRSLVEVRIGNGLVLPELDVAVEHASGALALCADTVSAVSDFAAGLAELAASLSRGSDPQPRKPAARQTSSADLLASLDFSAFDATPPVGTIPVDFSDDVPLNAQYLNNAAPNARSMRSARSQRRSTVIGGETITMLAQDGLRIVDDWLAEPRLAESRSSTAATKVTVRNCDFTIRLHEGYDWASTRKAIAERSKAVRRRLEKIRQLLASGQVADASGEEASVVMFGSVQLGLPPGSEDLPPKDLLAAIDQELEEDPELDEQTSVAPTWQAVSEDATQRSRGTFRATMKGRGGRSRRRLTRSSTSSIDIHARSISASIELYDDSTESRAVGSAMTANALQSRLDVKVTELEIIDNVKTSTWHKFLTELRPSDGGMVRPRNDPMARVEIQSVLSEQVSGPAQSELLLKAKVAPLRLYIDQDALDFLKKFGAFEARDGGLGAASAKPSTPAPFYQRVEILPVRLKVDYKPKRVDFNALRSGKLAELMNFFHFEGSEMTLRHLNVAGVSGTSTLSNLVQDIWTPDVKANQLADVVSGIAPLRTVVNVGSGVANLVLLPIEQYRKDGRIVRGLQKGAQAFAKQTTLEAIHTGARLATGTQVILEQAEHVLGGTFSRPIATETVASAVDADEGYAAVQGHAADPRSRYAAQPVNLRQGVEGAYKSFGENLKDAAQTILAVPMEVYERSGDEGAVKAVVRAVPLAVLKPMIGASGAVSKALLGLRNTLDPHTQENELRDKYKPTPERPPTVR